MKVCRDCGIEKNIEDFKVGKYKSNIYIYPICKECDNKYSKNYYKENTDSRKSTELKTHYGITLDDYNRMFEEQNGNCFICNLPETNRFNGKIRRLAVDHDHITGKIRGLLCTKCNTVLGTVDDNVDRLFKMIEYLDYWKEQDNFLIPLDKMNKKLKKQQLNKSK